MEYPYSLGQQQATQVGRHSWAFSGNKVNRKRQGGYCDDLGRIVRRYKRKWSHKTQLHTINMESALIRKSQ